MINNSVVVHTHFHKRRTGVTRSIENIFPYISNRMSAYIYGYNVKGKKISTIALFKLLFSNKHVTVHCHRNNEILRLLFFRVFGAKFKLVCTRHAETFPSKLSMFLFKKSDVLVTLTQKMSAAVGIENILIPHGVDTGLFTPNNKSIKPEIIRHNEYILCVGRIRKAKGQDVLIEASVPLLKENPNLALVIVGKVDNLSFFEDLKHTVKKNNLEKQIYFIDETEDILGYYQCANFVVVPSNSEGFSLVCAESMSCGITTIATEGVGIHSNLITPNVNGYLFKKQDSKGLNILLKRLCNGELPKLGVEARNEITKNWSSEKEALTLAKVYKSL